MIDTNRLNTTLNLFTIRSCGPRWGRPHHSSERDPGGGRAGGGAPSGDWWLSAGASLRGARPTQRGAVLVGRAERPRDGSDFVWRAPGLPLGPAGGSLHSGSVQRPAGHTESRTQTLGGSAGETVMKEQFKKRETVNWHVGPSDLSLVEHTLWQYVCSSCLYCSVSCKAELSPFFQNKDEQGGLYMSLHFLSHM